MMIDTTKPTTLVIWAHPRSRSTAVERCFLERDDVEVHHEPLFPAHYWGPERASPNDSQAYIDENHSDTKDITYLKAWNESTKSSSGKMTVVKNIVKHMMVPDHCAPQALTVPREPGNPTLLPKDKLLSPGIVHAFLIRSPAESVPSWYRIAEAKQIPENFRPDEFQLSDVRALYEFVAAESGTAPLIVDSGDFLRAPEQVLQALCGVAKLEYQPQMVAWSPDAQEKASTLFKRSLNWHKEAVESTGIRRDIEVAAVDGLPEVVQQAIDANMPDYEWLRARALSVKPIE